MIRLQQGPRGRLVERGALSDLAWLSHLSFFSTQGSISRLLLRITPEKGNRGELRITATSLDADEIRT